MSSRTCYYHGNAAADGINGTGWFLGQFVPEAFGLRHQADVELKWGVHQRGECRPNGLEANGVAISVSILLQGELHLTFAIDGGTSDVILRRVGDYVVFGPDVVHGWTALSDAIVLTVRFPSIDRRG